MVEQEEENKCTRPRERAMVKKASASIGACTNRSRFMFGSTLRL